MLKIVDKIIDGSHKNMDPININNGNSSTAGAVSTELGGTKLKNEGSDISDISDRQKLAELKKFLLPIVKLQEEKQAENQEDEKAQQKLLLLDELIVPNKLERSIIDSLKKFDANNDFNNLTIENIKSYKNNGNFQNGDDNSDEEKSSESNEGDDGEEDKYNNSSKKEIKLDNEIYTKDNENSHKNVSNNLIKGNKNGKILQQIYIRDLIKICKVLYRVFRNEVYDSRGNKMEPVDQRKVGDYTANTSPQYHLLYEFPKMNNDEGEGIEDMTTEGTTSMTEIKSMTANDANDANAIRSCNHVYQNFFKKIGSIRSINIAFAHINIIQNNDYEFNYLKQMLSQLNLKLVVESGCLKIKWENELNEGLFWFLVILGVATSSAGVGLAVNNFVFTFSTALVIATKTAAILSSASILVALVCLFILIWFAFNEGRKPHCAIKSPIVTQGREKRPLESVQEKEIMTKENISPFPVVKSENDKDEKK